jgi:hypothetical protein
MPSLASGVRAGVSVALLAVSQLCTTRLKSRASSLAVCCLNQALLTIAPPIGVGNCWYPPAKWYLPIIWRIRASVRVPSCGECKGSPCRRGLAFGSPDRLHELRLVLFGDRPKARDLPILLRQQMADEIVPWVKPEGRLHQAGKATDPDAIFGREAVC